MHKSKKNIMKGWFFLYNEITGSTYTVVEWKRAGSTKVEYRLSETSAPSCLSMGQRIAIAKKYMRPSLTKLFIIITEKYSEEYCKIIDFIGNIILDKTGFDSYNFIEI